MAKNSGYKFNTRDLLIAVLFIAVAATNYAWFQTTQGLNISADNAAKGWVYSESQIAKLKGCIDHGTKPCDLSTVKQP
jgi:hypothetical protein